MKNKTKTKTTMPCTAKRGLKEKENLLLGNNVISLAFKISFGYLFCFIGNTKDGAIF